MSTLEGLGNKKAQTHQNLIFCKNPLSVDCMAELLDTFEHTGFRCNFPTLFLHTKTLNGQLQPWKWDLWIWKSPWYFEIWQANHNQWEPNKTHWNRALNITPTLTPAQGSKAVKVSKAKTVREKEEDANKAY